MQKTFVLSKEEYVRMQQEIRQLPGGVGLGTVLYHIAVIVVGLYCFFRCSIYGIELVQDLWSARDFGSYWHYIDGATLFAFVLYLLLMLVCVYFLFFFGKRRILRSFDKYAGWIQSARTLTWENGLLQIMTPTGCQTWQMQASHTVFFTDNFIIGTCREGRKKRQALWCFPRRIFGQEEEDAFREKLTEYCDVRNEIIKTGKQLNRWDLTALFAAVVVQLFSFALQLVALQKLPGLISLGFWIYGFLLCPLFLLIYLIEAIRAFRGESGRTVGKIVNLILIVLSLLLFIPYGGGSDYAWGWAGIMGVVLAFQLRRLWLVSRDCGRGKEGFHVSFLKVGRFFLILTLVMDGLLLLLLVFRLSIREIHASLDQIRGLTLRESEALLSDEVFYCASTWIQGTLFACASAFCLLIEAGAAAPKQKKEAVRFLLLTAGLTALFFLRMCQDLVQFLVWVALIVGMILMIRRTLFTLKEAREDGSGAACSRSETETS